MAILWVRPKLILNYIPELINQIHFFVIYEVFFVCLGGLWLNYFLFIVSDPSRIKSQRRDAKIIVIMTLIGCFVCGVSFVFIGDLATSVEFFFFAWLFISRLLKAKCKTDESSHYFIIQYFLSFARIIWFGVAFCLVYFYPWPNLGLPKESLSLENHLGSSKDIIIACLLYYGLFNFVEYLLESNLNLKFKEKK